MEINRREAMKLAGASIATAVVPTVLLPTKPSYWGAAVEYAKTVAASLNTVPIVPELIPDLPGLGVTPIRRLALVSGLTRPGPVVWKEMVADEEISGLILEAVFNGRMCYIYPHNEHANRSRFLTDIKNKVQDQSLHSLVEQCFDLGFDVAKVNPISWGESLSGIIRTDRHSVPR